MKKVIFTLLLALAASVSIISCTEEEVAPSADNGGGKDIVIIKQ